MMVQQHVNYAWHVANFNEALSDSAADADARASLSRLHFDRLAQVMSFMGQQSIARHFRTLASVSPQTRLDAEMLMRRPELCEDAKRARVEGNRLMLGISATERTRARVRFAQSLWWATRCGLPLLLNVDNSHGDILMLLTECLRLRVTALRIQLTSKTACQRGTSSMCDGSCGSYVCALPTFSNLEKLSLVCKATMDQSLLTAAVNRALRVAAKLPVSVVELDGFVQLEDFSALAGSEHLCHLTAKHCGIRSVADLVSCPMMSVLNVSNNQHLQSLTGLSGAPRLEQIYARSCNLQNLNDLGSCPHLSKLDVTSNSSLKDFAGLAGAPCLEKLIASCCGLRSVSGLNMCPWLSVLDVSYNRHLHDLRGLSGAPCLHLLSVSGCELNDLHGLNICSRLSKLNVSSNKTLKDLIGLAGAASSKH